MAGVDLQGKVAIVTGGTRGIGRAIAESLLRGGARVFVGARDKVYLKRSLERLSALGDVDGEVCDVRSEGAVDAMFKECVRAFGGVDVLINNAGIGLFGRTVEETAPDDFRAVIETNLLGVFYCCRAAIPLMKGRGGGYIVNVSSLAGANAHPRMAAYNASKFALNGFSEALMQEVRHDNIRVSYVMPGSVNTEFGGDTPGDEKAWQLQPADVAQVVLDLLRHDARSLPSRVEIRPSRPPRK
jgi:NAD(P)-dependent dehydrogenase (short-subunit alcohol dehydrogenase family)